MRTPSPPLMIFAAGFGTRMQPLTLERPKPLIEVAGKPLIDHALDTARGANCGSVHVNMHYMADKLAAHLAQSDAVLHNEQPDILDTGGGLRAALPAMGSDVALTLNSDMIWDGPNPLTLLKNAWDPARMDALLICVPMAQTVGRAGAGDFDLMEDDQIIRGTEFVYGGAQIMKTGLLSSIEDRVFSLNLIWDKMAKAGRLFGLRYPGRWCDVGTPAGIELAEDMVGYARD